MNVNQDFNPEGFASFGSKDAFLSEYNLQDNGQQRDDDRGVVAEFYLDKVLLGFKSKEAGREIYEDREFVRIRIKGQDKTEVVREATNLDKMRFQRQYAQFKLGAEQAKTGTPIERLPGITPSGIHLYKQHNIRTIEDFSEVADGFLSNLGPGARELQRQAREFLSNGKAANAELEAKVTEQSKQLADAMALITKMQAQLDERDAKKGKDK